MATLTASEDLPIAIPEPGWLCLHYARLTSSPSVIDLTAISGHSAFEEMLRATASNPLEHLDRVFFGEVRGAFRRYVGVRQVLVLTLIPW